MIEDFIALRREISYLLSKGHLKELLGKMNRNRDPEQDFKRTESPPLGALIVNVISGGSNICGMSYSGPRKNANVAKAEKPERPTNTMILPKKYGVSFDDEDKSNIRDPHRDGLVITLYISNCFVRMILLDNGSSVNIIQLDTLKRMNIPKSKIVSKSSVLVGFNGEGRPWIHYTKVVPSTYHQCIKIPTPWGIVKIQGDQMEAKDCYASSMKPTA
ncbi:uncharacterized protein LOC143597214 [Bidens hawaiensis]|uniref:uncharacterized protein LOC143597214 n=1 Tax=Bidens hawaiensis TaxID=980011 RepID=UPI00404B5CDB